MNLNNVPHIHQQFFTKFHESDTGESDTLVGQFQIRPVHRLHSDNWDSFMNYMQMIWTRFSQSFMNQCQKNHIVSVTFNFFINHFELNHRQMNQKQIITFIKYVKMNRTLMCIRCRRIRQLSKADSKCVKHMSLSNKPMQNISEKFFV